MNAMNVSRLARVDWLKPQQPMANGISANIKLKLSAFRPSTLITIVKTIHMVTPSRVQAPAYPHIRASARAAIELLRVLYVSANGLINQVIAAGQQLI